VPENSSSRRLPQKSKPHYLIEAQTKNNVPKTIFGKCYVKLENYALRTVLITAETIA
jgi:hypothetical protein